MIPLRPPIWLLAAAGLLLRPVFDDSEELARRLTRQVKAEGSLIWSTQRLSWKQFHGKPKLGTSTAAQTSSGVTYIVECHGEKFRYAVLATFSPVESWVRPDIPTNRTASPRTLKHEQTHFDITEVFARRLRKAFEGTTGLCPEHPKDARKVFDRLSRESQETQDRYDDQTAHGMALDSQTRWNRSVAAGLDSLTKYRQE
jgi:hypothetical protein